MSTGARPSRDDPPALQHVGSAAGLRATVRPARGAKIVSLRDGAGREWLTRSARDPASLGSTFGTAEMAGWDECAPTIAACTVDGAALPEHGDLWDAVWTATAGGLAVIGRTWPYRLERTIAPTPSGGLRLDYLARNLADRPLPLLWAAHPQFAAPQGTSVVLDPAVEMLVDVLDPDRPRLRAGEVRLEIDAVPHGGARKVCVDPAERATGARLVRADGAQLHLTWSAACTRLGLWFDGGAYADERVIAIEPSTGFADSLADAIDEGAVAVLPPTGELQWWVRMEPGAAETPSSGG